ncbi:hypothetical protein [Acidovorax sp. 59]|uniref:hypothetical protein n=1 Tax=Acidovorax sp. 59 TaxID=2035204 RepID=UPI000C1912EF|nr:hypothetical protein [Acidovorax sp. 59]PIF16764.1 hypothetical protein CLU87_0668 [Acidovorax sp. 59]PKW04212.1 hypothetical protein CLU89_3893 [Acidovorax sp. 30]
MKAERNDDVQGGTAAALLVTARRGIRPDLLLAAGLLCAVLVQGAWAQSPQPETSACVRPLSKEVKNRTVFLGTRVFDTAVPHEDTKPKMILMKGFTLRVVGRFQEWVQLKGVNDKEFGPDSTLGWVHESELVKVNMELCRLG